MKRKTASLSGRSGDFRSSSRTPKQLVLYVGSGPASVFDEKAYFGHLLEFFSPDEWEEIRVDLNPEVKPDVVADACDLPFEDEGADAVVCLACLEHLPEYKAGVALGEFNRVLRMNGQLILQVPDLEVACRMVVDGRGWEALYDSNAGPVRALDLIYGHQRMAAGNAFQSHRSGFTAGALALWLNANGFDGRVSRTETDLWAYVHKVSPREERQDDLGCMYQYPSGVGAEV